MTTAEIDAPFNWLDDVGSIQCTHAFLNTPEPEFPVSGYVDEEDFDDDDDEFDFDDDDDYDDDDDDFDDDEDDF